MKELKKRFKVGDEMVRLLFVVVLVAIISIRNPVFLSYTNLIDVLNETSILAIVASGMMLVIVTGGIDISVGASLGLSGMVCALVSRDFPGTPIVVLMLVGMLSGLIIGALNGLIIARFRVIPLIATLGTMNICRASIYLVSNGDWVSTHQLAPHYVNFANNRVFGVSMLIYLMVLVLILMYVYTTYTRSARRIYALGSDEHAAQVNGINVIRSKFTAYAILGALTGLGGMLYTSRYGFATFETGLNFEMSVIAACVLGGVSITGGSGKVFGVLIGAILIAIINSALPMIKVSSFAKQLIHGLVILVAIVANTLSERRVHRQNLLRRVI